jgi:hypothetical protein
MSDVQQFLGGGFDTHSVEPQSDFAVIPPGKYPVVVEKAIVKPTKAGTGHYVELTLSILDGPFKNRKVWDRINIHNPNAVCVEIGLRSLAALGQAVGLLSISDTDQLVNQVCIAHVKVKDEQNEVRTYSPLTSALDIPQAPSTPPPQYPLATQAAYPPAKQMPPQSAAPPSASMPGPVNQPIAAGIKPPWAR